MQQRTLSIFRFQKLLQIIATATMAALMLAQTGCATSEPAQQDIGFQPFERVFPEGFENVWKATQLVLAKYPLKTSDIDSGLYETQFIKGGQGWISPQKESKPSAGYRYKLIVKILKGRDTQGINATKVTILKQVELQRDFFSETEKLGSDGLEERALMYRIERELQIEKVLKRTKKD